MTIQITELLAIPDETLGDARNVDGSKASVPHTYIVARERSSLTSKPAH